MRFDTKPNLSCDCFEQYTGDTLNLSGVTNTYGTIAIKCGAAFKNENNPQNGYVLTTDASGNATWQPTEPYTCASPSTCSVGGIPSGTTLYGKSMGTLFEELLVPYIQPLFTSFSSNIISPIEVGSSLSGNISFNWVTYYPSHITTDSIGIIDINTSTTLATTLPNTGTATINIGTKTNTAPSTWQWEITGETTQSGSTSNTMSICSIYPYYWGAVTGTTQPAINSTLINSGNKVIADSTGTLCVNFTSCNQWTWLAIPSDSTSKTCWYITDANSSNMLTTDSKFPEESIISVSSSQSCWTNVLYKVYMSAYPSTNNNVIQFRNC